MKASDVMTRNVVSVGRGASVARGHSADARQPASAGCRCWTTTGKVVGILTEGDLLRRSETGTETAPPALARNPDGARADGRRVCQDPRAQGRRDHDPRSDQRAPRTPRSTRSSS